MNRSYVLPRRRFIASAGFVFSMFLLTVSANAGETRVWTQSDYADFDKGVLKNLALRSDGLLTLSPEFQEVYDTSSSYLWAMARDSHGNLYTGGGPEAKLYQLSPQGDKKTIASLDGLQIQALAVDGRNRVYAATSPDGKVYRVTPDGKCEVFYNPKAKYIWALAFDKSGDLLVATGDPGAVDKVTPDGHGSVWYRTDETHVRSMALDRSGNVIVGTDPGGLVVRISPAGVGFVLYQMGKSEVTALGVAPDGSIYAAGLGSKLGATSTPAPPAATPPAAPVGIGNQTHTSAPPPVSMAPSGSAVSVTGSDVYRIDPSGNPERVWSHPQDVIYAIAFDSEGRPLLGSGNRGCIYRIESDVLYTALVTAPSAQITAFETGADGSLYAATANVGKVYRLGPHPAHAGSIESNVFDAGIFSQWGRLSFEARLNGGHVAITARSGNLDRPDDNWSPWSAAISSPDGERIAAPAARFVQWKAALTADGAQSPELESVSVAYLQRNVAPRVEAIESTPPNYKFPAPTTPSTAPQILTLPPIGKSAPSSISAPLESGSPAMQYTKGSIGARWAASDDNGDRLIFTVEIRGVHENNWRLLKDKLRDKYWSWDSTSFPDGEYRLRVTASDLPDNPPAEALSASMVSDPFLIDNTPPEIARLAATVSGGKLHATWNAADALSNIKKAEYSLDGCDWTLVAPVTGLSDSRQLNYDLTLDRIAPGEHTLAVRVEDDYDNQAVAKAVVK